MLHYVTPEMGDKAPESAKTFAKLAHYGRHYFLDSTLGPDVIKGMGVVYRGQYKEDASDDPLKMELRCEKGSKLANHYSYKVTIRAFEKLGKTIDIAVDCPLD
jgi:hypothetical protein